MGVQPVGLPDRARLTALWGLALLLQRMRYAQVGISTPKTLFLLAMAILLALNAIFLKPAQARD